MTYICLSVVRGHSTEARWTEVAHYQAHDPRACFSLSWTESAEPAEQDLGRLASTGGDGRILVWRVVCFGMAYNVHDPLNVSFPTCICDRRRLTRQS